MGEFLDKAGPRTFFEINIAKGVNISPYSFFPNEEEVLLLPGTRLRVVEQLDLGGGLVVVQLEEIPSAEEVRSILLDDKDAVDFWTEVSEEKFSTPLKDFCDAIFHRFKLPIHTKIDTTKLDTREKELYQKYWCLWLFGGGDEGTQKIFEDYSRSGAEIFKEDGKLITLEKFGLMLSFGPFRCDGFLDSLWSTALLGFMYLETLTSSTAANMLEKSIPKVPSEVTWLLRCSTRKGWPMIISYINHSGQLFHTRIQYNQLFSDKVYTVVLGKLKISAPNLTQLIDRIMSLGPPEYYLIANGMRNPYFECLFNPKNIDQSMKYTQE